ncbi:ABC transporter permease [Streptomyces longwoodensis]|uniref:ABC transporter permease n=1 Tax=Streptomyces longwoodensis TaxID=68231 RepID=UPI00340AAFE3
MVTPWVRTRLRAAPAAACALALLVAATAFLAAAFPRALDRYEDHGLRRAVERAHSDRTTVQVYAPPPDPGQAPAAREDALRPAVLAGQYRRVLATVRRPLVADPDRSTYGVRTVPLTVPDPWLPRPSGLPAEVVLVAQEGLAAHAEPTAGRLPRASGPVTAATGEVEAAVSTGTARTLHVTVGAVVHVPMAGRGPLLVRVTGIVAPDEPDGPYWDSQPLLHTPALVRQPGNPDADSHWRGALLLAPGAAPALVGTPNGPYRYWQVAPDLDRLHSRDVEALKSSVASLVSGPGLRRVRAATDPFTDARTDLDEVLTGYARLRSGITPLLAVAATGTGTVAAVVLLLAGGLAADRRRAELTLLRARGASLPGLAGRLLAETAAVALPAAALGLTAAVLLLPGARALPAVLAAGAVTVVGCAALPLRAAAAHRVARLPVAREDVTVRRPSRRRTVVELTVLVVAAGAVETLRRRGTAQGSSDQLVSAAPVLVGVIAALLLVRLHPLPLRALGRPAARLRGVVAPLALARAARSSTSATLPLLALLTALATAAFGGSVLAGVQAARDHAALLTVGADARVESTAPLPAGLAARVRDVPGVRAVTPVSIAYQAKPTDGRQSVPVVGVRPGPYAELSATTGLGPFPAGTLSDHGAAGSSRTLPLPAVASPSVRETYGAAPFPVRLEDGSDVTVRIVLVRERTPGVAGGDFLVVDRAGLSATAARPTALLLTGADLDGAALTRAAGDTVGVQIRAAERHRYVDSPLQTGADRLYTAAVAAGAGYALLALLLSLLRTTPERTALLARLRTMGLTRAQSRRLLVLESLPQAVLAAAAGTLTGWATIRLLSPGIDLTTIALADAPSPLTPPHLTTDPLSLTIPSLTVLTAALALSTTQAWWAGRRSAVRELRAGDVR